MGSGDVYQQERRIDMSVSTVIVVIIIAVGFFLGLSRIIASFSGKSCCSDGRKRVRVKRVTVADTDVSHYPYQANFLIGGMSCEGCAQNVANALNAVEGIWATVDLGSRIATVRSKTPIDQGALSDVVHKAGYQILQL